MIKKIIEIPEVTIPASTINLTPTDLTVFFENGDVSGIRMTLVGGVEPQHIEMKDGDGRWTDGLKKSIEDIVSSITALDTNEQAQVIQQARDAVFADAKAKQTAQLIANGEISEDRLPINSESLQTKA